LVQFIFLWITIVFVWCLKGNLVNFQLLTLSHF